ncbi:MAG TPA: F0F1 ATP synthase subunit A [Gemmatimonadales bacterium]|jgi:F-type H+-transporting ATPase subunit a|nr:F0F1 ATP synthase subunit A [Gemmatimonadales bacterium]
MMLMQAGEQVDIGEIVLHHTADAYSIDFYPLGKVAWHKWADIQLGPLSLNLTPTKHVVFLAIAALLVFLTMKLAGRALTRQRAGENAPKGFAAAMEGLVLWVRDDIAIANIGHGGARFAPLIMTLFFFILYSNLLGLIPYGSSPTGNLAVTASLAILVFFVIEIGGFLTLGPKGYLRTIFPSVPGLGPTGAAVMSVAMAPIEIIGKLVKPFALAVRLFGNMTAGHFVILSLFGILFLFGNLGVWSYGIAGVTVALVFGIMLLELFVAFLQAYVFALLSAVFIGLMQHEH